MSWSDEAFARAKQEEKPVLLHIGATWCHWCHVMDEGTYPHGEVIRLINERFVAIRVDTDHRPDINERYNQGGWPTCAVLDADGEVLAGRLYMPPHELILLLQSCSTPGQRWVIGKAAPTALPEARATVQEVFAQLQRAFDPYHGGFGELEKFPHTAALEWLLDRKQRGETDGEMLAKTLEAMVSQALYDRVEGGFFRYATRDDWQEVHYEKLLDDNARLLHVLLRSGQHRAAAEGVARWLIRVLWRDDERAFAGSMDADESYYADISRRGTPPPVDIHVYSGWNALAAKALFRAAAAWKRPGLAGLALASLARVRTRIREDGAVLRNDGGVYGLLDEQAHVAEAFACAFQFTSDESWAIDAGRVLGFAETLHVPEGGFRDAPAGGVGLLREIRRPLLGNAALGEAAWRLAALTDNARWTTLAKNALEGAEIEAGRYGFMASPAAALRQRLERPAVVVKVCANDALFSALWIEPDPELLVRVVANGVSPGSALACSGAACARPTESLDEVRRHVGMLRGPGPSAISGAS